MANIPPQLSDFRSRVSSKLGLNNTVAGDQPLIDSWINEAISEVLTRSRVNVVPGTMTLTGGSYDYTLPTQILALDEIYLTDASTLVWYRLERRSPAEIITFRVGTQFQGSPPVRWFALNGTSTLMVYPTPTAADTLTFYYIPRPAQLVNATDYNSDIPSEWQKTIEYYACWQAGQYMNDAASQEGNLFRGLYEDELAKLKKAAIHRGGRKLSRAVVGRNPGGRNAPIGLPSQQDV